MWDLGCLLVLKGKKAPGHTTSVCRDGGKRRQGTIKVNKHEVGWLNAELIPLKNCFINTKINSQPDTKN